MNHSGRLDLIDRVQLGPDLLWDGRQHYVVWDHDHTNAYVLHQVQAVSLVIISPIDYCLMKDVGNVSLRDKPMLKVFVSRSSPRTIERDVN